MKNRPQKGIFQSRGLGKLNNTIDGKQPTMKGTDGEEPERKGMNIKKPIVGDIVNYIDEQGNRFPAVIATVDFNNCCDIWAHTPEGEKFFANLPHEGTESKSERYWGWPYT